MPLKDKPRALVSWSSGKDSAWALHALRQQTSVEVVGLLTTFNEAADRVAMHAVRRELVTAQAEAVGLPLVSVELPWPCPNAAYEAAMQRALDEAMTAIGFSAVAFGDLFLEDVRDYRVRKMAACGLEPLFPIWHQATDVLAREMVDGGLRAYLTCVDPKQLDGHFVGRAFDHALLNCLPNSVDPCGARGEFHTFVVDGPMFANPIDVGVGRTVERGGFVFADIVPKSVT